MACAAHTENGAPAMRRSKPLHPSSSQPVQVRTAKNAANTATAKPALNPLIMAPNPLCGSCPRHEFFAVYSHFGHFLYRTAKSVDIFAIERPRRALCSAGRTRKGRFDGSDDADGFPDGWRPWTFREPQCKRVDKHGTFREPPWFRSASEPLHCPACSFLTLPRQCFTAFLKACLFFNLLPDHGGAEEGRFAGGCPSAAPKGVSSLEHLGPGAKCDDLTHYSRNTEDRRLYAQTWPTRSSAWNSNFAGNRRIQESLLAKSWRGSALMFHLLEGSSVCR
jgi:hypothetical protein